MAEGNFVTTYYISELTVNTITKIVFSDLEDKFSKLSVTSTSRIINIDRSYESGNGEEVPSRPPSLINNTR